MRCLPSVLLLALPVRAVAAQAKCDPPPGMAVDAYTEQGAWFGENRQFECANEAFRAALKTDPASAKLYYFLGLSLYSSGHMEEAVQALEHSATLDATTVRPRLLLGAVLTEQGRTAEAEEQWRAALALDPASTGALAGLSTVMIGRGDFQAAIDLLLPAERDPAAANEDLAINLARAYGEMQMLDAAEATLKQALAANPSSLRLTNALVTVYVHQHRFADGANLMRAYVEQHPDDAAAQIAYLGALVFNNDYTNARVLGSKLLLSSPGDFDVLYLNGILERDAGNFTAARDHDQQAVKLRPDHYSARYNLGYALAHLDDVAGAKRELEKAIELDPAQAEAHFQLAPVLKKLGDAKGAQQQLALYQQLAKTSAAQTRADTASELAAKKLADGDAQAAVALYRQAVRETPSNALLNYRLAMALDQAGDAGAEQAALATAVRLDPTLAAAQNQLGYLASRNNQPAVAEQYFRAAVKAAPTFTQAWINLAATLGQESHVSDAREAIATALRLEPANAQALQLSAVLNTPPPP